MEQGVEWSTRMAAGIGRRVARYRRERGLTAQALSDRCLQIGYRIDRSALAKLETGRRQGVTLAELLVLAEALEVPLPLLVLPLGDEPEVEILPGQVRPIASALAWLIGDPDVVLGQWDHPVNVTVNLYLTHLRLVLAWEQVLSALPALHAAEAAMRAQGDGRQAEELRTQAELLAPKLPEMWEKLNRHRQLLRERELALPVLPPGLAALEQAQQ